MVIRVLLLKFDQLFNRVYHRPFLHSCGSDYLLCWRGHEVEVVALLVCLARDGTLTAHQAVGSFLSESERLAID